MRAPLTYCQSTERCSRDPSLNLFDYATNQQNKFELLPNTYFLVNYAYLCTVKKIYKLAMHWWLLPIILATWEIEIRRTAV
jgi:hypothetical protein